jgi:hypothetical protein
MDESAPINLKILLQWKWHRFASTATKQAWKSKNEKVSVEDLFTNPALGCAIKKKSSIRCWCKHASID